MNKLPTIDCEGCNKNGGYSNGIFVCEWKPVGGIRITEEGGCGSVEMINIIYNKAKKRTDILDIMVNSPLEIEDLVEIEGYILAKINLLR